MSCIASGVDKNLRSEPATAPRCSRSSMVTYQYPSIGKPGTSTRDNSPAPLVVGACAAKTPAAVGSRRPAAVSPGQR